VNAVQKRVVVISHAAVNAPHRAVYERLARDYGWDVHVVAPSSIPIGDGARVKTCDAPVTGTAITMHVLPLSLVRTGRFLWFHGLARLLLNLRPSVVFAEYDPGSLPVILAKTAIKRFGGRVVAYTVENMYHPRFRQAVSDAKNLDVKALLRDITVGTIDVVGARATDALVCINREGAEIYRHRRGWRKPVATIPLGTDLSLFRPLDVSAYRDELGVADRFVVGYFGRLVPEKGADLLVEALARLPDDVTLLLDMFKNFAPGSFADGLLRRADVLRVHQRVVTVDVPHADVPRAMNCCDVIVLPSKTTPRWKEQFGRVLPEAMACGVPVIGSDSGNIPDMLGDAGLIFREGDVDALVATIRRVYDDRSLRHDLASRGRERVSDLLSVDVQARAMSEQLTRFGLGA
jgi:glycosyltransferase involved in cell wall biosynthesis